MSKHYAKYRYQECHITVVDFAQIAFIVGLPVAMQQMTCGRSFLGAFRTRAHTTPIIIPIAMLHQHHQRL